MLLDTFGIRFIFSWTGAALASAIITFPLQVRAIRLALEAVDPRLHQAAETLGAGALDRFVSITLPLALPGLIAGAITAFAASLGEFGAIITFVSNIPGETRTIPARDLFARSNARRRCGKPRALPCSRSRSPSPVSFFPRSPRAMSAGRLGNDARN